MVRALAICNFHIAFLYPGAKNVPIMSALNCNPYGLRGFLNKSEQGKTKLPPIPPVSQETKVWPDLEVRTHGLRNSKIERLEMIMDQSQNLSLVAFSKPMVFSTICLGTKVHLWLSSLEFVLILFS